MGGRGSNYISQQRSEEGLRSRAEEIHKILKESGMPAKKSIEETIEILRASDKRNASTRDRFNKKPDPEDMNSTAVYRELDRVTNKLEKNYTQKEVDSFKKNYNEARIKYSRGDTDGALKKLEKVPADYVRYRALDENMYGDKGNMRNVRFLKEFH